MATYKVLQDIEAEDKLIGPLTLRQFIYAGICAATLYLCFLLFTRKAYFILPVVLPVALVSGFFAWPWVGDQPTEIWALAKIRFLVKPRKRIWDQSGAKELVSVTAPKKIEVDYTNGLSETEVKSRLRALAGTIDSRGWAIKNVNVNLFGQRALVMGEPSSDRLVTLESLPQEVPSNDIQASDDMLDPQNNPVAHQFDAMITASNKARRDEIMARMRDTGEKTNRAGTAGGQAQNTPVATQPAAPPNNYWFMNQPAAASPPSASAPKDAVTFNAQVVVPGTPPPTTNNPATLPTDDEAALVQRLQLQAQAEHTPYNHLHSIQPLSAQGTGQPNVTTASQPNTQNPQNQVAQKVTQPPDAAILNLARNDDLNVATLAREAQKQRPDASQNEVVISLH